MSQASDANLKDMRRLCADVNASIARGDLPAEEMADFKKIVDEARLRLWASMEAANSGDPLWAQEFWLQRAAEMCQTASHLLEHGGVDRQSPRAAELGAAAARLAHSIRPTPPTTPP